MCLLCKFSLPVQVCNCFAYKFYVLMFNKILKLNVYYKFVCYIVTVVEVLRPQEFDGKKIDKKNVDGKKMLTKKNVDKKKF